MKFPWNRNQREEELDAEIRSHLDASIRDRMARGEAPEWVMQLRKGDYRCEVRCVGGCRPSRSNDRRRLITPKRFKSNAAIVARPVGVKPMSVRQSGYQAKCSCQSS